MKYSLLITTTARSNDNVMVPPVITVSSSVMTFDDYKEAEEAYHLLSNSHTSGVTTTIHRSYPLRQGKLTLIRGLPGSGKTTLAKKIAGENGLHFEADMFFGPQYDFKPALLSQAHAWCQDEVFKALLAGKEVVVSNTFTQAWEMQVYLNYAQVLGIEVTIFSMKTQYENIHAVPDFAIEAMKSRWEDVESEIPVI